MNCFKAKAEKTLDGWVAILRFPHQSQSTTVLNVGGKPKTFKTKQEAEKEALERLIDFLNADYQQWNDFDVVNSKREKAEKLFKKVVQNG